MYEIEDISKKHHITKIRIHGSKQTKSFFTNKGGEGRSLFFKEEMALSFFIDQYFSTKVEYSKHLGLMSKFYSLMRVPLIKNLKLVLILIKKIRYFRKLQIPNLERLFIVRSKASLSSILDYFNATDSSQKLLLSDSSLNAVFSGKEPVKELYNYFSLRDVFASIRTSKTTQTAPSLFAIHCGKITIHDDLAFLNYEVINCYPELVSHKNLFTEFVKESQVSDVISAEMKSAYSFVQEQSCQPQNFYSIWIKGLHFIVRLILSEVKVLLFRVK